MVKEEFELYCKGQLVCEPMDLIIKIFKNAHPVSINAQRLGHRLSGYKHHQSRINPVFHASKT